MFSGPGHTSPTFVSEGGYITFVEPVLAKHFRQETGRNIVRVQDLGCLRKFPNTFMISPGQETLLETLNTCITVMIENGSVAKLIKNILVIRTLWWRIS